MVPEKGYHGLIDVSAVPPQPGFTWGLPLICNTEICYIAVCATFVMSCPSANITDEVVTRL